MQDNRYQVKRMFVTFGKQCTSRSNSRWFAAFLGMAMSGMVSAQSLLGTVGLLNIPTADMNEQGTFMGGINYASETVMPEKFTYGTGIYYVNFTIFPFLEFTFRETLLKTRKDGKWGYYQQDRSTSFRLRPFKEGKYMPAVVLGINDPYADHGANYYATAYAVATKHIPLGKVGTLGTTLGVHIPFDGATAYDGVFGGVRFVPSFYDDLSLMVEYDSHRVNAGLEATLFNHLVLTCFTSDFSSINGGVRYRYTIKF